MYAKLLACVPTYYICNMYGKYKYGALAIKYGAVQEYNKLQTSLKNSIFPHNKFISDKLDQLKEREKARLDKIISKDPNSEITYYFNPRITTGMASIITGLSYLVPLYEYTHLPMLTPLGSIIVPINKYSIRGIGIEAEWAKKLCHYLLYNHLLTVTLYAIPLYYLGKYSLKKSLLLHKYQIDELHKNIREKLDHMI